MIRKWIDGYDTNPPRGSASIPKTIEEKAAPRAFYDQYQIVAALGRGSQGEVFQIRDKTNGENLAAKIISLIDYDFQDLERMRREAVVLQNVDHPNIPRCRGYYETENPTLKRDEFILVQELIAGESLDKLLSRPRRFTEEELQSIRDQTIAALTAAHERGIIHRDIKPANLLWTAEEKVYVTDFGIAKMVGQTTRQSSLGKGTITYMAPEQVRGKAITPATDYYGLGATLIALARGKEPDGFTESPLEGLDKLTHLSVPFRKQLEMMVSDDPQQRKLGLGTSIDSSLAVASPKELSTVESNPPERWGFGRSCYESAIFLWTYQRGCRIFFEEGKGKSQDVNAYGWGTGSVISAAILTTGIIFPLIFAPFVITNGISYLYERHRKKRVITGPEAHTLEKTDVLGLKPSATPRALLPAATGSAQNLDQIVEAVSPEQFTARIKQFERHDSDMTIKTVIKSVNSFFSCEAFLAGKKIIPREYGPEMTVHYNYIIVRRQNRGRFDRVDEYFEIRTVPKDIKLFLEQEGAIVSVHIPGTFFSEGKRYSRQDLLPESQTAITQYTHEWAEILKEIHHEPIQSIRAIMYNTKITLPEKISIIDRMSSVVTDVLDRSPTDQLP